MNTLITDATVVCVDPQRRIFTPGSLLVHDDRIADVGPAHEVAARNPGADVHIDGRGKVLLPGFVSVHNHLGYSVFRGRAEDIGHGAVNGLYVPMSTILRREERAVLAGLSAAELLRGGVTTILQVEEDADVSADFVERIGLRAQIGVMAHDILVERLNAGETVFDESVRAAQLEQAIGFAERVDGRGGGRIRAVLAANTLATSSRALLRELRDAADRLGARVTIHLGIGEADEVRRVHGAEPFPLARDSGFLDERAIAVHCYMVDDDDVALMGRSGASLAHCPLMNQFRGAIAPVQDLLAHGVRVGLGIDNYFCDHFDVMRACVAVARIRAGDPGVVQSPEVLARATIDSAQVMGLDAEVGSLEVGKKADLQLVDTRRYGLTPLNDPVRTLVYHGHAKDVDLVMVDGRVVVSGGVVAGVDEGELLREATRAAEAAWARFAQRHGGHAVRPQATVS